MSDPYSAPAEGEPTPPTPSPAEGEPGDNAANANPAADEHGLTPEQYETRVDAPYVSDPALTPADGAPPVDVVTTAADVTQPASTVAAPTAPGIPDETHNSIDPQTGALTAEALDRRAQIVRIVQEAGHAVGSFEEAIKHWIEMEGAKSPPGDLS